MKNKLTKYVICILAGILGILTIAVTLFLFLYIFWKGKNVMSLSFILDKPAGVPLGTAGGIYPALMGSIYLEHFRHSWGESSESVWLFILCFIQGKVYFTM